MADARTYHAWENMKSRCLNPKHPSYASYGGRGISVCERWRKFEAFIADMGEAPAGLSLDRIDNDRGYEPFNCRWTTKQVQQSNRRDSRFLVFRGERNTVEEWARRFHLGPGALYNRVFSLGWSVESALLTPLRKIKRKALWRTRPQI